MGTTAFEAQLIDDRVSFRAAAQRPQHAGRDEDYLLKRFDADVLLARVRAAFRQRPAAAV